MMTKSEIRQAIKERRKVLDSEWVGESSIVVQSHVMELALFRKASMVACYVAMPGEVRTDAVVDECWNTGKGVCVPAYRPEINGYDFARITPETKMALGRAGILEPADREWIDPTMLDVVLVPGLAFDVSGGRVGHGGGHYDRTLAATHGTRTVKIGLAFEFQVFASVPSTDLDVRMNMLVTEKRMIEMSDT